MKKAKKMFVLLLAVVFILTGLVTGCGTNNTGSNSGVTKESTATVKETTASESATKEKTKVDFWYLWGGQEAKPVVDLIDKFNKSQDSYEVVGLSVPDIQKIVVALSSGTGPDVTDNFSDNVASYADKGILLPLDEYMKKDNFDFSDFAPSVVKTVQYKGQTLALPINAMTFMLYYNKKLFAEAGIAEPPKTDSEMLADAIKLTKVESDGSISVLGYPDFPNIYFLDDMTFALGGDFVSADGKYTPDNAGTIAALKNIIEYRKKFGVDKIAKFASSAKYMDASADPFYTGKQAMRIDGPWFGPEVKKNAKDIDYAVIPLPYPEGKPELAKGGKITSSIFFIANNSKNKEGAWAFIKWLNEKPQMIEFNSGMSNIPARMSAWTDAAFANVVDFAAYTDLLKSTNLKTMPVTPTQTEFIKILKDESELAMNLKKSPEDAMKAATEKANALK